MSCQNNSVLAIVPARGGSKGLPGKNIINLCGKPLIAWSLEAAARSKYIDEIFVSTDDPLIASVAEKWGVKAPFLRPAALASDRATTISVLEHVIDHYARFSKKFDYIVLLEPTSPLRETLDIDLALERLAANRHVADSIVSVSEVVAAHPAFDVMIDEKGLIKPYASNFMGAGRRQDLPLLFFFEGTIYISATDALLQRKSFYHEKTLAYAVPRWKSFEIDDQLDLICVEAVLNNLNLVRREAILAHD